MSNRVQGPTDAPTLHIENTVSRKTAKPAESGFASKLKAGAKVALQGVEIGAAVVGGPLLGAAVHGARVGLDAAGVTSGGGSSGGDSAMSEARALQEQSQAFNLEYLALQEEVQQENRRFTTLSNVLKAKHETAKAAISNIRA